MQYLHMRKYIQISIILLRFKCDKQPNAGELQFLIFNNKTREF